MVIRTMTIEDYEELYDLWLGISGFGIRSMDDSAESVARFLVRNPDTCVVAQDEVSKKIIGSILCGHDGRTGYFYHVCVQEDYRMQGIGKAMADACVQALRREGINRVALIAFTQNQAGNFFWQDIGWTGRSDVNYYELDLNAENVTVFNA